MVTKEYVEALFKRMIADLGHTDWTLEWTSDECC